MKKLLIVMLLVLLTMSSFEICYADIIVPGEPVKRCNVSLEAGTGGKISPSGSFSTIENRLIYLSITPDASYQLDKVLVDGKSFEAIPNVMSSSGRVESYTAHITAHEGLKVVVSFKKVEYKITVTSSGNHGVMPSGTITVNEGATQEFKIHPPTSCKIDTFTVDGKSAKDKLVFNGDDATFTLTNINKDYKIEVTFTAPPIVYTPEEPKPVPTEPIKEEPKQEVKKFKIETDSNEGGKVNPTNVTIEEGKTVSFKITIDDGYKIKYVRYGSDRVSYNLAKDGKSATVDISSATQDDYLYVKFEKIEIKNDTPSEKLKKLEDINENDWYYKSVGFVVDNNLFNGTTETTFEPKGNLTRGMLVTVLYRLDKASESAKANYKDVDSNKYYSSPIAWAAKNNIVNGVSDDEFKPENNISRQDLATILFRYAQKKGIIADSFRAKDMKFDDINDISGYARTALSWCTEKGIITGKSDGILDPKGLATRAETAVMMERLNNLNS